MKIADLKEFQDGHRFEADLVIVGAGPAGLTVARQLFNTGIDILVLESGQRQEAEAFAALNRVEYDVNQYSNAQVEKRRTHHGRSEAIWSHEDQPYGIRCRGLGGSTMVWAGKSTGFNSFDFSKRSWVPDSGWPVSYEDIQPYLKQAAGVLNLGPNCYDEAFEGFAEARLESEGLKSIFWEFARSKTDHVDILRVGDEFAREDASNVRVLLNATLTKIRTDETASTVEEVEVTTIDGQRATVRATALVLAGGAIENARMLLAANQIQSEGLGNQHDVVGRYMMDHPAGRIAHFDSAHANEIAQRFGFYGEKKDGHSHMYLHGLSLNHSVQEEEGLLNCALYTMEDRSPHDPWDALRRLATRESSAPLADMMAVVSSPALLAKGVGRKIFESDYFPRQVRSVIVNYLVSHNPNFVVSEYQTHGIPHKLSAVWIDAICEQAPLRENRVVLSTHKDPMGLPKAKVVWKIEDQIKQSVYRLARTMARDFERAGLPKPILEDWIERGRPEEAVLVDMAHTMGTTRMSPDPKKGVVTEECRVHSMNNLYMAGGSVFPTGGHANPTLMITALSLRLGDHLREVFSQSHNWQMSAEAETA